MTSTPPKPSATTHHPAHTLLSQSHPPKQASEIFHQKVLKKPLLLTTTTSHTTTPNKRAQRRHLRAQKRKYFLQHQKPRPLSAKEKRALNLHALQPAEIKYSIYAGLNRLWRGYILEVLGYTRDGNDVPEAQTKTVSQLTHGSFLASADFHGMEVEVVRCKDVGRVGLKGIVVRETKGTIVVVTERDEVRKVIKRGAVFRVVVELPCARRESAGGQEKKRELVFELHGNQLEFRPVERAARKFKWHTMDYL